MFKKLTVVIGTFVLSSLVGCAHTTESANVPAQQAITLNEPLDADRFEQLIKRPGTLLVDVRTPQEYAQGHIAQAINIDVGGDQFAGQISKFDRQQTILIYCRSGSRTRTAANIMEQMEFKNIGVLQGGINQWVAQGKPITSPSN